MSLGWRLEGILTGKQPDPPMSCPMPWPPESKEPKIPVVMPYQSANVDRSGSLPADVEHQNVTDAFDDFDFKKAQEIKTAIKFRDGGPGAFGEEGPTQATPAAGTAKSAEVMRAEKIFKGE